MDAGKEKVIDYSTAEDKKKGEKVRKSISSFLTKRKISKG